MRIVFFGLAMLCLGACSFGGGDLAKARASFGVGDPTRDAFKICGSHDCNTLVDVSLTEAEFREIRAPFRPRPRTAGQERRALVEALRRFEVTVGVKTGYDSDQARSALQFGSLAQDCVDEMVNVATYLKLLEDAGDLRFHRADKRVSIPPLTRYVWTHTVPSVLEVETGQQFIIEIWEEPFGVAPYIMDREAWANGEPLRRDF